MNRWDDDKDSDDDDGIRQVTNDTLCRKKES